jgi:hypothetical protein
MNTKPSEESTGNILLGDIPMVTISRRSDHILSIGAKMYKCTKCPDDHPFVAIHETDHILERDDVISIRDQGEAAKIVSTLIREFELFTPDEWNSALNHIAERQILGTLDLRLQA